jgi:predicted membrane protein
MLGSAQGCGDDTQGSYELHKYTLKKTICMQLIIDLSLSYHIITRRRNPIGFLPEVWSPLQATVHLCGIFYLPWHALVQGTMVFSLIRQTLFALTTYSQIFVCALAGIEPAH